MKPPNCLNFINKKNVPHPHGQDTLNGKLPPMFFKMFFKINTNFCSWRGQICTAEATKM